ncbi:murein biosynthesis integral membrane protein MurJ [bacterium]|nr:murein biosynthesis integral membrane protein MurJ [bacterium]
MKREQDRHGILANFLISSLGTGLARIFGFLRDVTISHFFGATKITDIFWVAFTIPNVFRRFVADEGLTGAIIPAVAEEEQENGRQSAFNLTNTTFTFLVLVNVLLSFLGIVFAPALFLVFGSGFRSDPTAMALGIGLTRWLFSFVFFVSLVSFCEGILNYRDHFFIPKIAPGVVSASIVIAIPLLFTSLSQPIYAVVIGVLIGGLLHVLIHIPVMKRYWNVPRFSFDFSSARFRQFMIEMGKIVAIGLCAQLNIIILRSLASNLAPGSVSWYWYAIRLMDLAQGIIAVGMGSAVLPALARSISANDWTSFQDQLRYALRTSAFILLPVGLSLAVWSLPTVSILFRHGDFTGHDARATAEVLFYLIPSMWALAGINIIKKVYFALNERTALIIIGAASSVLIFITGYLFMLAWGINGLALSLSSVSVIQLIIYLVHLKIRLGTKFNLKGLSGPLLKMTLASISSAMVLVFLNQFGQWQQGPASPLNLIVFVSGWSLAFLVYCGLTHLLGLTQGLSLFRFIRRS